MKRFWIGLAFAAFAGATTAHDGASPVGLWATVDDQTGKTAAYVSLAESHGVLTGRIAKVLDAPVPDPKCDKCTDDRKDKPLLGMAIVRNLTIAADGTWSGGDILDPKTGKIYSVTLKLSGNDRLIVRGFLGNPLLGRNQTWTRVE